VTIELKLPDIGEGVVEGEVIRVLVKEGDEVREDQPLVEVMTEKVNVEIPAPRSGTVSKIMVKEGDVLKVGQTILILTEATPVRHAEPERQMVQEVRATPAVRKLAKDLHVDLRSVKGSGPEGRILETDVRAASQRAPLEQRLPLKGIRRIIADRMLQSKRKIPDVTLVNEVDITELEKIKEMVMQRFQGGGVRPTLLAFIMKAVSLALKDHPVFNSLFDEATNEIVLKKDIHLGIAIDTPDGLVVVKVRDAGAKSVWQLAEDVEKLSTKAREGSLQLDEVQGSTITITNIGAIGGSFGTPIINYPETAILGVYRAIARPVVHEGQIAVRDIMNISLTFDHRVTDGAEAARFLNKVKELIEKPALLLL